MKTQVVNLELYLSVLLVSRRSLDLDARPSAMEQSAHWLIEVAPDSVFSRQLCVNS